MAQQAVADSLHRVLRATRTDSVRVNAYNALSRNYRENHPDSTGIYALKARSLAEKDGYGFGIAVSHINYGNAFVMQSDYKRALQEFSKARGLLQVLEDAPGNLPLPRIRTELARAHASLGVVLSEENRYAQALEQYFAALQLYQKLGQWHGVSKAYNNIGILYKSQGALDKASEYLQKALKIQRETGEQSTPVTLTNLGAIYFEKGDNQRAKNYYDQALQSFKTIENARGYALLLNYLGDYYARTKQIQTALDYYNQSRAQYRELGNDFGIALVAFHVAELYRAQGKPELALASANQSLELARRMGTLDQVKASEQLLSGIYEDLGQQKPALAHYKAYTQIKDSLENAENTRRLLRAEMDFEYEKREALLHEQNKRRQQLTLFVVVGVLLVLSLVFLIYNRLHIKRRLTLQKEVAEYEQKALHLQMNPHFVFNCLSSISSFIVQNGTDSAIKYLSKFSKLMRLTLEYSKEALIPIDKEIEGLQNYLELEQLRFNKKFQFTISSSADIEDDMALPPLLIQPFVENAILHGLVPKESDGRIDVSFAIAGNQLVCTIADDGIGFTAAQALKANSVRAHESMALGITRKRLEMIEATTTQAATVDISEQKDHNNQVQGTRVTLRLPIRYTSDLKPKA